MKTKIWLSAALIATALTGTTAFAADKEGAYVNIGATLLSIDVDTGDATTQQLVGDSANFTFATGRVGYRLMDYIAIEGELGFGLGGESSDGVVRIQGVDVNTSVDLNIDTYYAAFARGIFPVSDSFDIFARVGYGATKLEGDITASAQGFSQSDSASEDVDDVLFGGGVQYNFTKNDGVRVDYTKFDEANIVSVAYARRF